MESLKELEKALKQAMGDLRGIDSQISIKEGSLQSLAAKKADLESEVALLEQKKNQVQDEVATMERKAMAEIDARLRDVREAEDQLLADRADLKTKTIQAENAIKDAQYQKEQYAILSNECAVQLKELQDKKRAVLSVIG